MLKGLLLSVGLISVWAVAVGWILHAYAPRRVFGTMAVTYLPTVPAYILLYLGSPADLGLLPKTLVGVDWRIGLLNGCAFHVLLFLTAGLFYSHADRSITIHLLIALSQAPNCQLTLTQMQERCGIERLMEERLDILVDNGFLRWSEGRCLLTAKGWVAGSVGAIARRILKMKPL